MMYDANKCLLELVKTSIIKKHYHNSVTKWIRRNFIRTRHSAILQQLDSIIIWLGGCKKKLTQSFNYNVQFYLNLLFGSIRLGK
ncbi:hypothetical protein ACJMK2_023653 [Sinanodonta woodiana]|uniref:Uncharacterized protein n=1 Tax=Sinanodonta woodiana TaxID=1069815 RepID=A0ABD3T4Y9_SINWO